MNIFSKSGAVALYINESGQCCGVKLASTGELLKVDTQQLDVSDLNSQNNSDLLRKLVSELKPQDDHPILVAIHNLGSSVDLDMPNLPAANLKKALEFEIPKLTPLSENSYTWGYRVVENRGDQGLIVRVSILKMTAFESAINLVSKIEGGVEMILPVEQAAQGETDFIVKEHKIAFSKNELGLSKIKFETTASYIEALIGMKLNPSDVREGYQESFYKAITTVKYAIDTNLSKDVKTWVELPTAIYTTKKRNLKMINLMLFLALIGLWGWVSYLWYADGQKEKAAYQQHMAKLTKELAAIQINTVNDEVIKKIQSQMDNALRDRLGVANILAETTNIIPDEFWCEKFRFDGERLVLSIVSSKAGQEIGSAFKDSEVFTVDAVRSQARSAGGENITLELLVNESHLTDLEEEKKK